MHACRILAAARCAAALIRCQKESTELSCAVWPRRLRTLKVQCKKRPCRRMRSAPEARLEGCTIHKEMLHAEKKRVQGACAAHLKRARSTTYSAEMW